MTQREKLIELIMVSVGGCARHWAEVIADYLLENGVVVLPCRCGECEYHELEEPGMVYCSRVVGGWVSNGDFCSGAKRKGGE